MAHIDFGNELPGIRGPMAFRPETAAPLNALAEVLLRSEPHSLSRGEREIIAAYVSRQNQCAFCERSHSAFAAAQVEGGAELVEMAKSDPIAAEISPKLRALLGLAGNVARDGRSVADGDIEAARAEGASDVEIHDTVLIAAAFCMFNRYVDGLGTWAPEEPAAYAESGRRVVEHGYGVPAR